MLSNHRFFLLVIISGLNILSHDVELRRDEFVSSHIFRACSKKDTLFSGIFFFTKGLCFFLGFSVKNQFWVQIQFLCVLVFYKVFLELYFRIITLSAFSRISLSHFPHNFPPFCPKSTAYFFSALGNYAVRIFVLALYSWWVLSLFFIAIYLIMSVAIFRSHQSSCHPFAHSRFFCEYFIQRILIRSPAFQRRPWHIALPLLPLCMLSWRTGDHHTDPRARVCGCLTRGAGHRNRQPP